MTTAITQIQPDRFLGAAEYVIAQQQPVFRNIARTIDLLGCLTVQLRSRNVLLIWKMEQRRELYGVQNALVGRLREKSQDICRHETFRVFGGCKLEAVLALRIEQRKRRYDVIQYRLCFLRNIGRSHDTDKYF